MCCLEKAPLAPHWNCFLDLLSVASVIIMTQDGSPQRTLPLCLADKALCSEPRPPVDGTREEMNTFPCPRRAVSGDVCQTDALPTLSPHLPAPPDSVLSRRKPGNLDKKEEGRGSLSLSRSVFALMRGDWMWGGPRPAPEENPETTQRWVSSAGGPTTPRLSQN